MSARYLLSSPAAGGTLKIGCPARPQTEYSLREPTGPASPTGLPMQTIIAIGMQTAALANAQGKASPTVVPMKSHRRDQAYRRGQAHPRGKAYRRPAVCFACLAVSEEH